jgi:hypothetical protein
MILAWPLRYDKKERRRSQAQGQQSQPSSQQGQQGQSQQQRDQSTGQAPQRQQGQQGQTGQAPQQGQTGQPSQTQPSQAPQQGQAQQGQAQQGQAGGSVNLTTQQRTQIRRTVLAGGNAPRVNNVNFSLRVGTTVPTSVRVVEVPPSLIEIHPQWRRHMYFVVGDPDSQRHPSAKHCCARWRDHASMKPPAANLAIRVGPQNVDRLFHCACSILHLRNLALGRGKARIQANFAFVEPEREYGPAPFRRHSACTNSCLTAMPLDGRTSAHNAC